MIRMFKHVFFDETFNVEADIVSSVGNRLGFVMHFDGEDFTVTVQVGGVGR